MHSVMKQIPIKKSGNAWPMVRWVNIRLTRQVGGRHYCSYSLKSSNIILIFYVVMHSVMKQIPLKKKKKTAMLGQCPRTLKFSMNSLMDQISRVMAILQQCVLFPETLKFSPVNGAGYCFLWIFLFPNPTSVSKVFPNLVIIVAVVATATATAPPPPPTTTTPTPPPTPTKMLWSKEWPGHTPQNNFKNFSLQIRNCFALEITSLPQHHHEENPPPD